jgi:hypothetical protein
MIFDEQGICVLESIIHPNECDAYMDFLDDERWRHHDALDEAKHQIEATRAPQDGDSEPYDAAFTAFYQSAATRHQQDIDAIDRLLPRIEAHKAKLEGK